MKRRYTLYSPKNSAYYTPASQVRFDLPASSPKFPTGGNPNSRNLSFTSYILPPQASTAEDSGQVPPPTPTTSAPNEAVTPSYCGATACFDTADFATECRIGFERLLVEIGNKMVRAAQLLTAQLGDTRHEVLEERRRRTDLDAKVEQVVPATWHQSTPSIGSTEAQSTRLTEALPSRHTTVTDDPNAETEVALLRQENTDLR